MGVDTDGLHRHRKRVAVAIEYVPSLWKQLSFGLALLGSALRQRWCLDYLNLIQAEAHAQPCQTETNAKETEAEVSRG